VTDSALFIIGFGIFAMCIGGTLVMSIGGSQPNEQDVQPSKAARPGGTQE
jgi:hypothetical protein